MLLVVAYRTVSAVTNRPDHGTASRYKNYGCRCSKCRAANAKAQRDWRASVKESS